MLLFLEKSHFLRLLQPCLGDLHHMSRAYINYTSSGQDERIRSGTFGDTTEIFGPCPFSARRFEYCKKNSADFLERRVNSFESGWMNFDATREEWSRVLGGGTTGSGEGGEVEVVSDSKNSYVRVSVRVLVRERFVLTCVCVRVHALVCACALPCVRACVRVFTCGCPF